MIEAGETLTLSAKLRRRDELGDDELQHAMIDQPHEAEALGDRHDVARRDGGAVGPADPHQAFMEGDAARERFDDRLEGGNDAALVQRADDGVARAHVLAAHRLALGIGTEHFERAAPPQLSGAERFVDPGEQFVNGLGVARRHDAAHRHGHRDRPGPGEDHLVAHRDEQALAREPELVRGAIAQDQPELVPGQPAEMIAAAQIGAQPLHHRRNHLVADRESIGLVDAGEIVDRDDEHGERRPQPVGVVQDVVEQGRELPAVHPARQVVGPGGVFSDKPFVDDAHDAMGACGPAIGPGEPAPDVLDAHGLRFAVGRNAVPDSIEHAVPAVALIRAQHDVAPRDWAWPSHRKATVAAGSGAAARSALCPIGPPSRPIASRSLRMSHA